MKLRELKQELKGVFKPLVKKYYLGRLAHGCPYFYPLGFCSTVMAVMNEKQQHFRCNYFLLFGKYVYYGWPVKARVVDLGWKDKYGDPRYEWSPAFHIYFFKWQFSSWYLPMTKDIDTYFEMFLWYYSYCGKDLKKAKESWGWEMNGVSTWDDNNLITKI